MIGSSPGQIGPQSALRSLGGTDGGKTFNSRIARRLLALLSPYRGKMIMAVLLMTIASALNLLAPYLIMLAIDRDIAAGDVGGLIQTTGLLALTYGLAYFTTAGMRFLLGWVGQNILATLRSRLFQHLQRLHLGYHDQTITGVTVSRVINDVGVINELLTQGLVTIIGDILLLCGTIAVMLSLNARLALYSFAVIPVMISATVVFSRFARAAYRRTRRTVASVVGDLAESISGMRVIQAFSQEKANRMQFDDVNIDNMNSHIKAISLSYVFLPVVEFLSITAIAIVLWFGGLSVATGQVTLGIMVAFLSYVTQFFQPIRELAQIYSTMQSAMAGGEQVFRLLDTEPEVRDIPNAPDLEEAEGHIEFRNVCFSYVPGIPVLKDITFTIEAGSTVALVGPTGAGKSSIANVVARFYEIDSGSITLDGHDIQTVTQQSLRRHMALITQDPFLFSGTLLDNIRFGCPAAREDAVFAVAKRANIHSFIESLPDGYNTIVQEGSVNLSHGQRQLIAIARAMLAEPRVLIMDEATSNVDSYTETLIQDALDELLQGRTAIVIAHRLSTIRKARCVYVVNHGRIVESGTHAELISKQGVYAELAQRQGANDIP